VEAAGQRLAQPYEAWIAADLFRGGVRVLITGPQGFARTVAFALDESPMRIARSAARRRMAAAKRKPRAAGRKAKAATPVPAKAARKKRRLIPEGRADRRGDEEAVGGAAEGQGGGEISGAAKKSRPAIARPKGLGRAKAASRRPAAGGRKAGRLPRRRWRRRRVRWVPRRNSGSGG
jgi:hypothetical protein